MVVQWPMPLEIFLPLYTLPISSSSSLSPRSQSSTMLASALIHPVAGSAHQTATLKGMRVADAPETSLRTFSAMVAAVLYLVSVSGFASV